MIQVTDDCGWVLGHYVYTYDNHGYIVGEQAEEAREMDPYGRERYTPYVPEKQGGELRPWKESIPVLPPADHRQRLYLR